jgi:glycosyltransferase involved in cell wall biosynthesis
MSDAERDELRRKAVARIQERYSWDAVTDAYEKLLSKLAMRQKVL